MTPELRPGAHDGGDWPSATARELLNAARRLDGPQKPPHGRILAGIERKVALEEKSRILPILTSLAAWSLPKRGAVLTLAFVATFMVDLLTPVELSVACLYLLPLSIATWCFGESAGLLCAAIASACAILVERWGVSPYSSAEHFRWALAVRIVIFGGFVWALHQAKLAHARLVYRCERDELTGLYNRRGFRELADREIQRARRYGRPLSVAFLDLDDFKSINDDLGHLEGDFVLQTFAGVLNEGRQSDICARLGGDEFVILMPETERGAALGALERLRIRARSALAPSHARVTFTAGLVTFESMSGSVDDLLRAADGCLYDAKRSGKASVRSLAVPRTSGMVKSRSEFRAR